MRKFIILSGLFLLMSGCATSTKKTSAHSIKLTGQTHKNETVEITPNENTATVLVFLSAICPCSKSHIPELKKLSEKFPQIKFYGIHSNYNENQQDALQYFEMAALPFPVVHDSESLIAKKYGALKTPHAFILNNQGEVIFDGAVTSASNAAMAEEKFLEIALSEIQMGKIPSAPKRKTLGCYIALKD
jgi:peroxiredoxin